MKITGIKKAVGDYKRYNAGGMYSPEYGKLMIDRETGEVWTDYFYSIGHNEWKVYHDHSVINLADWIDEYMLNEKAYWYDDISNITIDEARKLAEKCCEEYRKEMEE